MFAKTQKSVSMILGVALLAGAAFEASAFAGEPSLATNERAAQNAIVDASETVSPASVAVSSATLSRNEDFAHRAIVDAVAPSAHRDAAVGDATLAQNESAAQRAIVDAAGQASVGYAGDTTTRVASARSPTEH